MRKNGFASSMRSQGSSQFDISKERTGESDIGVNDSSKRKIKGKKSLRQINDSKKASVIIENSSMTNSNSEDCSSCD
jgi:hypothetical protein